MSAAMQQQAQPGMVQKAYGAVAEPLTRAVSHVAAGMGEGFTHPEWTPEERYQAIKRNYFTPAHELPPLAREVAEFVVPQTPTAGALTALSMALPPVKAARVLGEAAGPVTKFLGNRLARMGAGTAIGAGAGALSGEGATSGALQGAGAFVPGEMLAAGAGIVGRHLGEAGVVRDTTAKFGKAISDRLPWLNKMEKGSDFANAFIHGGAVERAGNLLRSVKGTLGQRTQGYHFPLPAPADTGIEKKLMGFDEADKLITQLQQGYGFTPTGAERTGMTAREARALSYEIRDRLAGHLDTIKSGLGNSYLKARKQFDAAATLTKMFDQRDLIGPEGLNQPKLIERMNEHSTDLGRSMGKGAAQDLLNVLRRGFVGEGKDIPGKAGKSVKGVHMPIPMPYYVKHGGQAFDPIGKVPGYIRPSGAPIEAAISNIVGRLMKPTDKPARSPAVKAAEQKRAETIAGSKAPPETVDRVKKISGDVRSGKTPNVHHALSTGRISTSNVRDILEGGKPELASVFEGLSPEDAIGVLAKASPEEKQTFLPIIAQKLNDARSKMPPQQQQALMQQLRSVMAG
jgi:hypothetical protein